ncbi:MAG TPA: chemotaxis protein CheW [Gemmatimonadaceae bacterium]|nr:chemotaxis protein CheW [Gemmatimonadaceae bacterium]
MSAPVASASRAVAPTLRLVTFGVGEAWYAAEIAFVERVLRREGVQPVPNMPAWMDGVLEHQGRFIPVIDLRQRFALPSPAEGAPPAARRVIPLGANPDGSVGGRLLVLSCGDDVVAAAVDRVVDVRSVAEGELAPPPRLVRGVTGEFVKGMVRRDAQVVHVLDIPRLLSPDEHRALDGFRVTPRSTSPFGDVGEARPDGDD